MEQTKEKQRQRTQGMAARKALSSREREQWDAAIAKAVLESRIFQKAEKILSYRAMGGEVAPSAIDAAARTLGKQVAYPISLGGGHMMAAVPDEMERGMYGIEEPKIGACRFLRPEELDLILVPCTAFDERCFRVGMGGGYYDRYLPACIRAYTAALAYEVQKVDMAAVESWDQPLRSVVTEHKIYHP